MIAAAAYAILVPAHRLAAHTSLNPLAAAMSLLGITPADAGAAGLELALMRGETRCEGCKLRVDCVDRLSRAWGRALPQSCPNASRFHEIARHKEATASRGAFLRVKISTSFVCGPGHRFKRWASKPGLFGHDSTRFRLVRV